MEFILLLVHGIFDDKKLLNSLKVDRNHIFADMWLQIQNFSEGLLNVFSAFHGIFLRNRLLDFFGG